MTMLTLTDDTGFTLEVPDWFGFTYSSIRNPVSIIEAGHIDGRVIKWIPRADEKDTDTIPDDHPAMFPHVLVLPVTVTGEDLHVDSNVLRHDITGPSLKIIRAVVHEKHVDLVLPDGPPVRIVHQPGGEWRFDMEALDKVPESLCDLGDYKSGWQPGPCTWKNDYSTLHETGGDPLVRGDVSDWYINARN